MEESNLYKPNWGETFIQEASHLVQMQMQAEVNKEQERLAAKESGPQHDVAIEEGKNSSESEKKSIKITNLDEEKKEVILPKLDVEKKTVDLSNLDDEARERLAQELIEEEEKEAAAASKKKNKGKGKGKVSPGGHSKQGSS